MRILNQNANNEFRTANVTCAVHKIIVYACFLMGMRIVHSLIRELTMYSNR